MLVPRTLALCKRHALVLLLLLRAQRCMQEVL
jgi:hypothetical protein